MGELSRGRVAVVVLLVCGVFEPACGAVQVAEGADACVSHDCLRPQTSCDYDSLDCSPAIEDVVGQVERIRQRGERLGFHLRAMEAPTRADHWQSIQRMAGSASNVLVVTRSTPRPAQAALAVAELRSRSRDGGLLGSNEPSDAPPPATDQVIAAIASATAHTHAGGTQLAGKMLAVPLEANTRGSQVELYDLQTPAHPVRIATVDHAVVGGGSDEAGTASLAKLDDGSFLLVIGRRDARTLDFYRSSAVDLGASVWTRWDTWQVDELRTAIDDDDFGDYQNLNLIASTDGRLYLLGLHEDGLVFRSQWIDLFEVGGARDVTLTKVAKHQLTCGADCNLDAGGGSYIDPRGRLLVYGIEYANGGPDASIRLVEF